MYRVAEKKTKNVQKNKQKKIFTHTYLLFLVVATVGNRFWLVTTSTTASNRTKLYTFLFDISILYTFTL